MATVENISSIDALIGMSVLSRATGNKLGQVSDLIVDPIKGMLLGLAVQAPDGNIHPLDYHEIYSFGQDAVMTNNDNSIMQENERLVGSPLAKKNITGAQIVTEGGKVLGQVANIFLHRGRPPLVIYEIRESLLDRLLGRALFIPASFGRAMSDGAERIVVPNDAMENSADSLEALASRQIAPLVAEETVIAARNSGEAQLGAFREGSIEIAESSEVPIVTKQAHVVEELIINKDADERTEIVRDTLRRTEVDVERLDADRVSGEPTRGKNYNS